MITFFFTTFIIVTTVGTWCNTIELQDMRRYILEYVDETSAEYYLSCTDYLKSSTVNRNVLKEISLEIRDDLLLTNAPKRDVYGLWWTNPDLQKYCPCLKEVATYFENPINMYIKKSVEFGDDFYDDVTLLANSRFSEEAVKICSSNTQSPLCTLVHAMPMINAVSHFPQQKSQWTVKDVERSSAIKLHILLLQKQYPNEFNFLERLDFSPDSELKKIVTNLVNSVLSYMQNNEISSLKELYLVMPRFDQYIQSSDCNLDKNCLVLKILEQFSRYVEQIELYEDSLVIKGRKRVLLNTGIDYTEFLKQIQLNRILQVIDEHDVTTVTMANALKEQIETKFLQLKSYYQQVQIFNSDIAKADIAFITGRLEKFKNDVKLVVDTFIEKMKALLGQMFLAVVADLVESIAALAVQIAHTANPLAWLFGGVNPQDISAAFAKVAQAMANLGEGIAITVYWANVGDAATNIANGFKQNNEFLETVKKLIFKEELSRDEFQTTKNDFLAEYTKYDPQVTKADIVKLTATWTALQSAICTLIYGLQTSAGIGAAGIIKDQNLCVDLPILAETMGELYENMYDFQFDLMDALAEYMRAEVAVDAAEEITTDLTNISGGDPNDPDIWESLQLVGSLTYTTYKTHLLQGINHYCNILQYSEGGELPKECKGPNTDMAQLISRTITKCTSQSYHFYYVPTAPSGPDDEAYVDTVRLFYGATVNFKIPNSQWLIDHDWIKESEKNKILLVEKLEVYLPTAPTNPMSFLVTADPILKNQITPTSGSTEYMILPNLPLSVKYVMGPARTSCPIQIISNPYTSCEAEQSSFLCHSSLSYPRSDRILYPSIYTQWAITVEGGEHLTAPDSATDMAVIFGIQLCEINKQNQKFKVDGLVQLQNVNDCCQSGQYRPNITTTCVDCPAQSHSALSGYYCAKD